MMFTPVAYWPIAKYIKLISLVNAVFQSKKVNIWKVFMSVKKNPFFCCHCPKNEPKNLELHVKLVWILRSQPCIPSIQFWWKFIFPLHFVSHGMLPEEVPHQSHKSLQNTHSSLCQWSILCYIAVSVVTHCHYTLLRDRPLYFEEVGFDNFRGCEIFFLTVRLCMTLSFGQ